MKMTNPIILDSSALVSLISSQDSNHQKAKAISQYLAISGQTVLLPGEVFTESLNIIGKKFGKNTQLEVGSDLLDPTSTFTIIETNPEIRAAGLQILAKQSDTVSYTDCLVMAWADHFETREIFGFDHHFDKNGYLLPSHKTQ